MGVKVFSHSMRWFKRLEYGRIQGRGPQRGGFAAFAGWNWENRWEPSASVQRYVVPDEKGKIPLGRQGCSPNIS
jgi:hypothetical protein